MLNDQEIPPLSSSSSSSSTPALTHPLSFSAANSSTTTATATAAAKILHNKNSGVGGMSNENLTVVRLMKELSVALNGRGRTVDKLQTHLQELLIKLQMEELELIRIDDKGNNLNHHINHINDDTDDN